MTQMSAHQIVCLGVHCGIVETVSSHIQGNTVVRVEGTREEQHWIPMLLTTKSACMSSHCPKLK